MLDSKKIAIKNPINSYAINVYEIYDLTNDPRVAINFMVSMGVYVNGWRFPVFATI
jgi:hypothetical protein